MASPSFPEVVWPVAGTTSKAVELSGITVCGFYLPSGWTGTSVTFLVCDTIDGTFVALQDETGTPITYTVAASKYCRALPADLAGIRCLKMVGGSSQSAGTVVKLAARPIA